MEGERGETIWYLAGPGTYLGLREAQSQTDEELDRYRVGVHHVAFEAPSRVRRRRPRRLAEQPGNRDRERPGGVLVHAGLLRGVLLRPGRDQARDRARSGSRGLSWTSGGALTLLAAPPTRIHRIASGQCGSPQRADQWTRASGVARIRAPFNLLGGRRHHLRLTKTGYNRSFVPAPGPIGAANSRPARSRTRSRSARTGLRFPNPPRACSWRIGAPASRSRSTARRLVGPAIWSPRSR